MKKTVVCALLWLLPTIGAHAQPIPFIDTHAHIDPPSVCCMAAAVESAQVEMKRLNISKSILMSPPQPKRGANNYDIEELRAAVKQYPDRFALLGGVTLNIMIQGTPAAAVSEQTRKAFRERAEKILSLGAVGFGEISIEHLALPLMGPDHPYEAVPGDHPLLFLLADVAAENDVPIDLHFDVIPEDMSLPPPLRSPPNPAQLRQNISQFERLLAHNRKAKIVWAHVGQEPLHMRTPSLVRGLLSSHSNLYMNFRLQLSGPHPARALDNAGKLKPMWLQLINEFPDRFMLGSDVFYTEGARQRGANTEGMDNLRSLIDQLPDGLARKVASENAIRLYRLKN